MLCVSANERVLGGHFGARTAVHLHDPPHVRLIGRAQETARPENCERCRTRVSRARDDVRTKRSASSRRVSEFANLLSESVRQRPFHPSSQRDGRRDRCGRLRSRRRSLLCLSWSFDERALRRRRRRRTHARFIGSPRCGARLHTVSAADAEARLSRAGRAQGRRSRRSSDWCGVGARSGGSNDVSRSFRDAVGRAATQEDRIDEDPPFRCVDASTNSARTALGCAAERDYSDRCLSRVLDARRCGRLAFEQSKRRWHGHLAALLRKRIRASDEERETGRAHEHA